MSCERRAIGSPTGIGPKRSCTLEWVVVCLRCGRGSDAVAGGAAGGRRAAGARADPTMYVEENRLERPVKTASQGEPSRSLSVPGYCSRSHVSWLFRAGLRQLLLPRRDAQRRAGGWAAAGAFTRESKSPVMRPGTVEGDSPIRSVNSVARKPLDEEDNPSRRLIRSPDCDESQLWAR